jgi:ABC-2 type transport system ATP-binding protein
MGYRKRSCSFIWINLPTYSTAKYSAAISTSGDLSKGNIKKVGIAAALLGQPEAVLLDEPFENLDPSSQIRLKRLMLKEKTDHLVTFVISSHDLNHVTELCERIVLLEKGAVIKDLHDRNRMKEELAAYFNVG